MKDGLCGKQGDRQTGDKKRNQRDGLNDLMRGGAQRTIVIRLPRGMAVDSLHHARHQHKRNAEYPQQTYKGRARARS